MRELPDRMEKTKPEIFHRHVSQQSDDGRLVLGTHWTRGDEKAVPEHELTFPLAGIWPDREPRLSRKQFCWRAEGDARVQRQDAVLVRKQRVDVEPMDLRTIGCHLG